MLRGVVIVVVLSTFAPARAQVDVGPQIRIDVDGGTNSANETSIAASPFDPIEIVATWNDWREGTNPPEVIRMGVAVSNDGGDSWSDFLVRPPLSNQSSVEGDPMTAVDPRTGTLWVGAISFAGNGGVYVARKNPGESTFAPSVMADPTGSADKCWMAAGIPPGNPDDTNVYIAYNLGLITSLDMGDSWNNPVSLGSGLGFLPRVGPNGEVYIAYWDLNQGLVQMRRSFDGGQTVSNAITIATRMDSWIDHSRTPGTFRTPSLSYLAVDPNDGTLYCVYADVTEIVHQEYNVDLYFTSSTDQGDNWSVPQIINGDADPPGDQVFPWLEVDEQGRLHLVFLDSRNTEQMDNDVVGFYDVYYAFSDDQGQSWQEYRLTPESFSSEDDALDRPDQFLGDYFGLAVSGNTVYPCYLSTQNGDPDIFTNVITVSDCTPDAACPADTNDDGFVNINDLLALLGHWGACACCSEDVNGDGDIDVDDLLALIAAWGPC